MFMVKLYELEEPHHVDAQQFAEPDQAIEPRTVLSRFQARHVTALDARFVRQPFL